jgi:predicted restriction endonuclease
MSMGRRDWTVDEVKLAYYLYCQLPFGRLHGRNPEIIELAKLIDRTPSAVAMKLVNLASLDNTITSTGRSGLKNASRIDRQVWDEFKQNWEQLTEDAILQRTRLQQARGQSQPPSDLPDPIQAEANAVTELDTPDYSANNRLVSVLQREKQSFFRRTVLSSYRERCCMSGLAEPKLLIASHIIPWSEDPNNRLNPANGLCLSAIHDRAFDQHLISLDENFRIIVSDKLKRRRDEAFMQTAFLQLEGKPITLPERFAPHHQFLARHREVMLGT